MVVRNYYIFFLYLFGNGERKEDNEETKSPLVLPKLFKSKEN